MNDELAYKHRARGIMRKETIGFCHICNKQYDTEKDAVGCCVNCELVVHSGCGIHDDEGNYSCHSCDIEESGDYEE